MSMLIGTQVHKFRILTLRKGLELEIKCPGFKVSRGKTCYSIIKKEFGFKGNKAKVLEQINWYIESYVLENDYQEAN